MSRNIPMRLPEAKIREAILHPDRLVREEALSYFADCYSRDEEVMPVAIQALQTYGHGRAFEDNYHLAQLAQTEATVEWAIEELHREEDQAEDNDPYFSALSQVLCSAEPHLLVPRADRILQAPGFDEELVPALRDTLQLASWDAEQCWQELERIAAEIAREDGPEEVDYEHIDRVVRALALRGDQYVDRMLDLLQQQPENYKTDPRAWLEIFLVKLAGEMRLERAIPLIVKKLHEVEEYLSEACLEALGKIGTDAAAEAVTEGWLESEWDYRLYASEVLEKIHSDTSVRKCLELLPREKEIDIRTNLADALLGQFADEGIEPVRRMVERRAYDETYSDLMRKLVAVSPVVGVTFPEHPIWKREVEERLARQERRTKELLKRFEALPPPLPPPPAPVRETDDFPEPKLTPFLRTEKQVGRNDPCPCGSGKKFKKCCLNRSKG